MTRNQIAYEELKHKRNIDYDTLDETKRANRAREHNDSGVRRETERHNRRTEALNEQGLLNNLYLGQLDAETRRYVADTSAAATRYSADSSAAASRYVADSNAQTQRYIRDEQSRIETNRQLNDYDIAARNRQNQKEIADADRASREKTSTMKNDSDLINTLINAAKDVGKAYFLK